MLHILVRMIVSELCASSGPSAAVSIPQRASGGCVSPAAGGEQRAQTAHADTGAETPQVSRACAQKTGRCIAAVLAEIGLTCF